MPLEFRRQRDGSLRDTWFGAFELNGKRYGINLGVKIAGKPPVSRSLKDQGDTAYEVSRMAAQSKLDHFIEEARKKSHTEHLVEKLYEIKTGEPIKSVALTKLQEEWAAIPRRRELNTRYADQCDSTLERFVEFVQEKYPKVQELILVTPTIARAFLDLEAGRGVTAKTWNDTLKLLRAAFKYLLPAGAINPFALIPTKETDTVFRIPFTPEELKKIMAAAEKDEFIEPIIITGVCTAMRRGDCCLLEWKDVDLSKRFITVKTSKTGQTVSIPIFPMLYDELADRKHKLKGNPEGYVFPEQAKTYLKNPDNITMRVKRILAAGLDQVVEVAAEVTALPQISQEEARQRGEAYIATLPDGDKRNRMTTVFHHYMTGKNIEAVMEAAKVSKGSVSGYLNEIEAAVGSQIIRGKVEAAKPNPTAGLQVKRKLGLRLASVRDFHSFRVTWVTLALTAGVPLELVQKVTGHKTTDIVLKHYFQPGREAFRAALQTAMPRLLMNGQKTPQQELHDIVSKMDADTWKRDKPRILKLLKKL